MRWTSVWRAGMMIGTMSTIAQGGVIVDWQVSSSPLMPGVASHLVYNVNDNLDGVYNHHPALAVIGNRLVATWSNHLQDHTHTGSPPQNGEDGPGQKVMISTSTNGVDWTPAVDLLDSMGPYAHAEEPGRAPIANGFAWVGDALYAIVEGCDVGTRDEVVPRARTGLGRLARRVFPDGSLGPTNFWIEGNPPEPLSGYPQFPDPVSNPEFASAAAAITNDLAQPLNHLAWDFVNPEPVADGQRMVEPSTYQRPDGSYVRLYRDVGQRGYLYAAENTNGVFVTPVQTNIPDAPSKTISLTLPDGRICIIGNFQQGSRDPLSMAISHDGIHFTWARRIRSGAPAIQFPGPGKGVGFQYPSAVVVGDTIHLVYSIGKEDIAYSSVPIPAYEETAPPEPGVIAHWDFDEGTVGSRVTNDVDHVASIQVDHFRGQLAAVNDEVEFVEGPPGFGTAANFDSVQNGVDRAGAALKSAVPLTSLTGLSALTVEAFVYVASETSLVGAQSIFRKSDTADSGGDLENGYVLNLGDNGKVSLRVGRSSSARATVLTTNSIPRDRWVHVAGTWESDSGVIRLYIDGEEQGVTDNGVLATNLTGTLSGSSNDGPAAIGALIRSNATGSDSWCGQFFDGYIDEVRVSDFARTPDQFLGVLSAAGFVDIRRSSSNGLELAVSGLSGGASNVLERSFNLLSNDWTEVYGFQSAGPSTNLTLPTSNSWDAVYYRLRSLR